MSLGLVISINEGLSAIVEKSEVWVRFDQIVRIGETVSSQDDVDMGKITMDKPKMVTKLSWDKKYI